MKEKLKGIKFLLVIFAVVFVFGGMKGGEAQATSKATKAKKAYKNFLTDIYENKDFNGFEGNKFGEIAFVVKDISGDKVPN